MRLSYGIERLRSLQQTPLIEIRPITLLVGRNSAGKSTFLRSMPLIRQSIETRSSAPILWWGDLVDFGDFQTAVTGGAKDAEIKFRFHIRDFDETYRDRYAHRSYYNPRRQVRVDEAIISYGVASRNNKTVPSAIELEIPSENLKLSINYLDRKSGEIGVKIDGIDLSQWVKGVELTSVANSLFSAPYLVSKAAGSQPRRAFVIQKTCYDEIERILTQNTPKNISDQTKSSEVRRLLATETLDEKSIAELSKASRTQAFSRFYSSFFNFPESEMIQSVRLLHRAARAAAFIEVLDERLSEFFNDVAYIGPVRAASERFYRRQELEVSEISSSGSNFAMFLASLPTGRLGQFSKWVESIFGYGVELGGTGGHISINLKADGRSTNITDTGYGVSQILPVLGTIWWSGIKTSDWRPRSKGTSGVLLAIEQPELHLHPAHQAKLADVLMRGVRDRETDGRHNKVSFLVETHSESLINRIGELIPHFPSKALISLS